MGKSKITIKDIARELGISPSTVSRALKDHPDISPKTRKAVQEFAEKYHYKPNALALSLRSSKSNLIGVIIPRFVHFFFSSVIDGIEHVAQEAGYRVIICQSDENFEKEVENVKALITSRVDGVLASLAKTTHQFDHFRELMDDNIPLVFFDRVCTELDTPRVVVDDYHGALMAVEHLIKTGCRRIAHLAAPQHLEIAKNRKNGYVDGLIQNGLTVDPELIKICDSRESALVVTQKLFELPNPPDGIFAVNDLTASGALSIIKKNGLRIPEDISVCGFSDGLVARVTDPPLTTVEQHGFEVGKAAAELLLERIRDDQAKIRNRVIKTNLVVRESTRSL